MSRPDQPEVSHDLRVARSGVPRALRRALAGALTVILCAAPAFSQFQMPDPKQMSGIPRPVTDLPDNTISIRVIRGSFDNNVVGQKVELHFGSEVRTTTTDQDGRAEFSGIPAGTPVTASANVDGEDLQSQQFPFPGQGGIRLMLVATDKNVPGGGASGTPAAPAVAGAVTLSDQSRIIVEPDDDAIRLYYILEIANKASAPANPPTPFEFDLPAEATGAALLEGSTLMAQVQGTHVSVGGPFPPGSSLVQIGMELPSTNGRTEFSQAFPAAMDEVAVIIHKLGATNVSSPQLTNRQEVTESNENFIQAVGPPVSAGTPITLTVTGMPHHSPVPRRTALGLALAIVLVGVFVSIRQATADQAAKSAERKRLLGRRDKLLSQLVRLDRDHRAGRGDSNAYPARREELVHALEQVYGALDDDDAGPDPTRAGLAA
jgi:hypothetical protein